MRAGWSDELRCPDQVTPERLAGVPPGWPARQPAGPRRSARPRARLAPPTPALSPRASPLRLLCSDMTGGTVVKKCTWSCRLAWPVPEAKAVGRASQRLAAAGHNTRPACGSIQRNQPQAGRRMRGGFSRRNACWGWPRRTRQACGRRAPARRQRLPPSRQQLTQLRRVLE
jgi:hypothetical protein